MPLDDTPLRWWRTRHPDRLCRDQEGWQTLRSTLIAFTAVGDVEDLKAKVRGGWNGSGISALLVASRLDLEPGIDRDLVSSWLLVAAITGNERAIGALVILLARRAKQRRNWSRRRVNTAAHRRAWRWEAMRCLVLSRAWAARAGSGAAILHESMDERLAAKPTRHTTIEPKPDDAAALPFGHPGLKVALAAFPDVGGWEARQIAKTYAPLQQPLPLAGGRIDPDILVTVLAAEFPWMAGFTDRVREALALRRYAGAGWFKLPPYLLLGPPGTGKTRIARRLADLIGVGYGEMSAAGADDARFLRGTARGWASAQPSAPAITITRCAVANPLFIVDEVDKAGTSASNGRIVDVLLAYLEAENAKRFFDEALLVSCDFSQISWIMTANSLDPIPAPLLSRVTVIRVGAPEAPHLDAILHGIRRDLAAELNVRPTDLPELGPEGREELRRELDRSSDLRKLGRAYRAALAASVAGVERPLLT